MSIEFDPNLYQETREIWWNINHTIGKPVFYSLAFAATVTMCWGVYSKLAKVFAGKPIKNQDRFANLSQRLVTLFTFGILHRKTSRKKVPGIAHALTYSGFLALFVVTTIVAVQEHLHLVGIDTYFFQGLFYKAVSFAGDLGGLVMLLGVLVFTLRRYVFGSRNLDNTQNDWVQPAFLLFFAVTGFMLEAQRIAATGANEPYAFIGNALANLFKFMTIEDLKAKHAILWWVHGIATFVFVALIPYSKFMHIFTAPLTIFFRSDRHRGQLSTPFKLMDLMEAEMEGKEVDEEDFMAGVFTGEDFSWKTLLDAEACTACGRCHVVCPAQNTDKALSPKHLMLDIKHYIAGQAQADRFGNEREIDEETPYSYITEDVLWSCTTCSACAEQCPVLIEHVDTIVDMRRGLLAANQAPSNLQATLKNIRTKSNPWGLDPNDREKWIAELKEKQPDVDIKIARENKGNFEYLYWVGSPGAYDTRNIEVTKANVQLFTKAGIDFAVLGNEEKSSGDIARRAGDEGLYQEIVIENIETMISYGVKKVITQCPHVYNTLKNEYPEFGFEGIEVIHHSELLADLIKEGKIEPTKEVHETITYHDPCYLGRYNRTFDPPRFILESIPGLTMKRIEKERENSTCCGGGGAQMWYEMEGTQINMMRLEELNEHSPDIISVACPYCSVMMSSATSSSTLETSLPEVEDIAITLAKSVL